MEKKGSHQKKGSHLVAIADPIYKAIENRRLEEVSTNSATGFIEEILLRYARGMLIPAPKPSKHG